MKRIFVILISIMMLLSFAGCGKETAQEPEESVVTEETLLRQKQKWKNL